MNKFCLGRLPVKKDKRNIQFKDLLFKQLAAPSQYDVDKAMKLIIDNPMYGNDEYGDCVIAGRGHHTRRMEYKEQNKILQITDQEILNEYFKETGGQDSGLIVLDSLNKWRQNGWIAGGANYKIQAFSQIQPRDLNSLKQAIYLDLGVGCGIAFPDSAMDQFNKGQWWGVVKGATIEGGHYVYIVGYNAHGPVCVTWGRKQQMTWNFWKKYCEECYVMFDAKDSTKFINFSKLQELLEKITR